MKTVYALYGHFVHFGERFTLLLSVYVPLQKNTDFHILDKTDKNLTGDVVTNLRELSVHFVTPPRADLPNWVDLGTNFLEGGAV